MRLSQDECLSRVQILWKMINVITNKEGLVMQCAKGARLDGRFGKIGCVYGDIFFVISPVYLCWQSR